MQSAVGSGRPRHSTAVSVETVARMNSVAGSAGANESSGVQLGAVGSYSQPRPFDTELDPIIGSCVPSYFAPTKKSTLGVVLREMPANVTSTLFHPRVGVNAAPV